MMTRGRKSRPLYGELITARVRSTRECNVYIWECLSVHKGGRVPHPLSTGGTPSTLDGGTPILPNKGVPPSSPDGGYPILLMRAPPYQVRTGGYLQLEQHNVYLLCGGRYASCIHARGLSCFVYFVRSRCDTPSQNHEFFTHIPPTMNC